MRERRWYAGGEHHRAQDVPQRMRREPAVVDRRAAPVDASAGVGEAPVGALAPEPGEQDPGVRNDSLSLLEPREQRVGDFRRDRQLAGFGALAMDGQPRREPIGPLRGNRTAGQHPCFLRAQPHLSEREDQREVAMRCGYRGAPSRALM